LITFVLSLSLNCLSGVAHNSFVRSESFIGGGDSNVHAVAWTVYFRLLLRIQKHHYSISISHTTTDHATYAKHKPQAPPSRVHLLLLTSRMGKWSSPRANLHSCRSRRPRSASETPSFPRNRRDATQLNSGYAQPAVEPLAARRLHSLRRRYVSVGQACGGYSSIPSVKPTVPNTFLQHLF
jgi:hypothetical protein